MWSSCDSDVCPLKHCRSWWSDKDLMWTALWQATRRYVAPSSGHGVTSCRLVMRQTHWTASCQVSHRHRRSLQPTHTAPPPPPPSSSSSSRSLRVINASLLDVQQSTRSIQRTWDVVNYTTTTTDDCDYVDLVIDRQSDRQTDKQQDRRS